MELLVVLAILGLVMIGFPLVVLLQAWLLTVVARGAVSEDISFGMALLTVVVASMTGSCCSGMLLGSDGGLVGAVLSFLVYTAMLSLLNSLEFGKALVIAVVMTVIQWLIALLIVGGLVVTGLAAALGIGALATL